MTVQRQRSVDKKQSSRAEAEAREVCSEKISLTVCLLLLPVLESLSELDDLERMEPNGSCAARQRAGAGVRGTSEDRDLLLGPSKNKLGDISIQIEILVLGIDEHDEGPELLGLVVNRSCCWKHTKGKKVREV